MVFKTWQKYLIAIVPMLIIGAILVYFSDIVGYILAAWVVSMIGAPIYRFFNRFMKDGISAGLTLLVLSAFLLLMIRLFVPPLITQAKNLAGFDYHKLVVGLEEPLKDLQSKLVDLGLVSEEDFHETKSDEERQQEMIKTTFINVDSLLLESGDSLTKTNINLLINIDNYRHLIDSNVEIAQLSYFEKLRKSIFEMFNPSRIQLLLSSFVSFFGGIFIAIMSVFFITFFFLKEGGLFTKMVAFLVPEDSEAKVNHAIEESSALLIRYFVGLIIQVLVITVITSIVLKLFGLKSALLMAFCFAIFNLIPYLGPLLGNFMGVLIVISSNINADFYSIMMPKIITTIIIFTIVQMLDNFLLQPNIFSKSVKAHPLEIFLIVLMGAKMGGVVGMVLAVPTYTVIRVLLKVFFSEFVVVKKLTNSI